MKCPKCGAEALGVSDSRDALEGATVRRRRRCEACAHRFTTVEVPIPNDEGRPVDAAGGRHDPLCIRRTFDLATLLADLDPEDARALLGIAERLAASRTIGRAA